MHVCVYIYIFIYIYIYVYLYVYIFTYIHIHIHMYTYIFLFIYVCLCVCAVFHFVCANLGIWLCNYGGGNLNIIHFLYAHRYAHAHESVHTRAPTHAHVHSTHIHACAQTHTCRYRFLRTLPSSSSKCCKHLLTCAEKKNVISSPRITMPGWGFTSLVLL